MNTTDMTGVQISALADNELAVGDIDMALAALRQHEGRQIWNRYHQIGDALRSDDLNTDINPELTKSIFARLEAEPTFLLNIRKNSTASKNNVRKRLVLPGIATAAVAVMGFLALPEMSVNDSLVAQVNTPFVRVASAPEPVTVATADGDLLRDSRIDEYLLAHQRFSPSVYSTAQYARSATFAVDTDR